MPQLTGLTHWDSPEGKLSQLVKVPNKIKKAVLTLDPMLLMQDQFGHDFGAVQFLALETEEEQIFTAENVHALSCLTKLEYLSIEAFSPLQGSLLQAFNRLQR